MVLNQLEENFNANIAQVKAIVKKLSEWIVYWMDAIWNLETNFYRIVCAKSLKDRKY